MTAGCISDMDMDTRRKWEMGNGKVDLSPSGKVIGVYTGYGWVWARVVSLPLRNGDALMHNVRLMHFGIMIYMKGRMIYFYEYIHDWLPLLYSCISNFTIVE
jgi:hypothetical protein